MWNTDDQVTSRARECVGQLLSTMTASEFGYKVQVLAAHVLSRLGYGIDAINQSGHPDLVAAKDGREFCFEVEAEVERPRMRWLTEADLKSLTERVWHNGVLCPLPLVSRRRTGYWCQRRNSWVGVPALTYYSKRSAIRSTLRSGRRNISGYLVVRVGRSR